MLDPYWEHGEEATTPWEHSSGAMPPVSGRHAAPRRTGSHGRRAAPLALASGVLCAALALGFVAGGGGSTTAGAALTPGQNISDNLQRTDLTGLGSAPVGGRWSTYPPSTIAVTLAGATIAVKPGESSRAILQGVRAANEVVRTVFTVPAFAKKGNGTYFGLDLRRQTGGQSYRAQLNLRPGGVMVLRLVKRVKSGSSVIGKPVSFPTPRPGTKIAFEAAVTGTKTTLLQARWWNYAATRPGWQTRATDRSPGVLASAGRFGVVLYQSGTSGATSVRVHSMQGWLAKPDGTSSAPSTTAPAPSSTKPTTTAPAPTQSHPTTTTTTAPPPNNQSSPPVAGGGNSGGGTTVGNSNPSSRGSLAPGKTSYAVPAGAVFVSPSGSASGDGSKGRPVSTISRGVQLAKSGGTIVVRGGTYHEEVSVPPSKRLTIQSYPGEAVWLDGSTAVTGWTRSGNGWVHTNWTARFDHTPGWSSGASKGEPWVNSRNPMAAYPDQVWINGSAQRQVGSLSSLTAGTFYVDTANKRLYTGSNPSSVRASDLQVALMLTAPGSVFRGIGVRRYATSIPHIGTVRVRGDGSQVQNVLVLDSASVAMDLTATNLRVDHVTVQNAGLLGVHASLADGLAFTNSVISNSNSQLFNYKPVAGGFKAGSSRNVRFVGNTVTGSHYAMGVWFDVSSYNITVANNTVSGNGMRGIQTEISQNAIIVNNLVTNNAQSGICVFDTGGVQIWNNTLSGNAERDIIILQDGRTPSTYHMGWDRHNSKAPNPSIPWVVRNVHISNNLLLSNNTNYEVSVYDTTQKKGASGMGTTIDGNVFSRPTTRSHHEIGWSIAHKGMPGYSTPEAFTKATGQGHNNRDFVASTTSAAYAAAHAAPLGLPSDVAAAAGRSAGTRHVGVW